MMDRQWIGALYPKSVAPLHGAGMKPKTPGPNQADGSFQAILDQQFVKLSRHAEQRMAQRSIRLDSEKLDQISGAIDKAAAKGAKDSLILMRDLALIVNVKQRTIVTVMDETSMKDRVFTQIDSTIVLK